MALLARINNQFAKGEPGYVHKELSAAAKALIARHSWPGNIRELNNVLVQSAVMAVGATIGKSDLAAALTEAPVTGNHDPVIDLPLESGFDLTRYLDEVERRFLERAREESGGIKSKAAELLGLKSYQSLDSKLKRLGIRWR